MNHKNETPLFSLTIGEFRTLLQDEAVLARSKSEHAPLNSENVSNRLFGVTKATEFLQISKATLYAMNSQNRIQFIKAKGSGKVYYKESTLREWLDNGEQLTADQQIKQAVGGAKSCK